VTDRDQLFAADHDQLVGRVPSNHSGSVGQLPVLLAIEQEDLVACLEVGRIAGDSEDLPGSTSIHCLESERLEGLSLSRKAHAGEGHHRRGKDKRRDQQGGAGVGSGNHRSDVLRRAFHW